MNIGDYLKFDDRAREYLNRFYAKKINEVSNKYIGCGALAIEKIYEIEKQRDSEIKRHEESGLPPTNMWQMYAIEWGEANPGMTFDQALKDCYAYAKAPIVGIDLLSGEGSISIKEAKEMFGYSNNESIISPEILEESLRISKHLFCLFNRNKRKNKRKKKSYKHRTIWSF
jgi:hypothetical protein